MEITSEADYELKLDSLENRALRTELRSVTRRENRIIATVFVPEGKLSGFVKKIESYGQGVPEPTETGQSPRPRNEKLVAGISEVRFPVLQSFWTDEAELFPTTDTEQIWWEVWIRIKSDDSPETVLDEFKAVLAAADFRFSRNWIRFPERVVFLAWGAAAEWMGVFVPVLDRLAELRRAKEIPTEYVELGATDQAAHVNELAQRLDPPTAATTAVCLLDYGVQSAHPLLSAALAQEDVLSLDPAWSGVDPIWRHGTEMAGLVLFGESLPENLAGADTLQLEYWLESVQLFRSGERHAPDTWGKVTQSSVALAEANKPRRSRVVCMAATADDRGRDNGRPSQWSAGIDEYASGYLDDIRRLFIISAGNVDPISTPDYSYLESNIASSRIEDPGQSWNALTVGAFTSRVHIQSADFDGHTPVAPASGLCPSSRTSVGWDNKLWPLKPDIVMEGGNYAQSPDAQILHCDDLCLLTTTMDASGRQLTTMRDTSAATALASRYGALLMAQYPRLWPETVRGLLVHSAEWTDEMCRQVPGTSRADKHKRLRCFGYGVPDLGRARHTVENCVSLIHQGAIQPFKRVGSEAKPNKFALHALPWPRDVLRDLHNQDVTVRITLSYFIEPSPQGRGWKSKYRYASHGLRFRMRGPSEGDTAFRRRVSKAEWEDGAERPSTSDPIEWEIGYDNRSNGSIHSDWFKAPAADVARCDQIAIFPTSGWWRERKHLNCVEKTCRYALIITISSNATDIDLYTPIAQEIGLVTEITT
ncbi:MAG TPA: S8 family peptidase [Phycisphaerae bacterium]|nr:S8 family peptidase [Phycisphaerae bacterium]HRW53150.1 S8 family peptidase [Phycisphaerae bacterium]